MPCSSAPIQEGLDHLDEAMAAATGGEADMLETVAEACCSLVAACDVAGDTGRLEQWARIVTGFVERRADLPLLGFCRTCDAQMLAASGRYGEAEQELVASAGELRSEGHRSRCVDPAIKLAEVRLRQGRFEEAASLLNGREGLPEATLPAAQLHLAQGDTSLAISVLLRRLNDVGREGLLAGPLLSGLVEAHLAAEDTSAARAAAADLERISTEGGHPLMGAYARLARGRVAAAASEPATDIWRGRGPLRAVRSSRRGCPRPARSGQSDDRSSRGRGGGPAGDGHLRPDGRAP